MNTSQNVPLLMKAMHDIKKGNINWTKSPAVYKYLEDFFDKGKQPYPDYHFLFIGDTGCGKTLTAQAINAIMPMLQSTPTELYSDYLRLLDSIAPDKHRALDDLQHLLCHRTSYLDDLGTEPPTTSSRWYLGNLLINQYDAIKAGKCKMSIITTNLDKANLQKAYGDRVVSRLMENYTVFFFNEYDFRSEKRNVVK